MGLKWFACLCIAVCFAGVGSQRGWGSSGGYNSGFSNAWNSGSFGGSPGSQQNFQNSFGQSFGGSSVGSSGLYSSGSDKNSNWGGSSVGSSGDSWQSGAFNVRPTEGKSSSLANGQSWKEKPSNANQNTWNAINGNNYNNNNNNNNENDIFNSVDYEDNSVSSWNSNNKKKSQPGSNSFGGSGKWETTTAKSNKNSGSNRESNSRPSSPSGGSSWSSNAPSKPGKDKSPPAVSNQATTKKPPSVDTSVLDELDQNDWYFGKESNYPKPPFKSTLDIDVSELWNFDKNRRKTNQGFGGTNASGKGNSNNNNNNNNNNKFSNNYRNDDNYNSNNNNNNYRNDDNTNSSNNKKLNNSNKNNNDYRNDGTYNSNSNTNSNYKNNNDNNSNNYRNNDNNNSNNNNKFNKNNSDYRNDGTYNSNTNTNNNYGNSDNNSGNNNKFSNNYRNEGLFSSNANNKNGNNKQYNSNKNNGNSRRRNRQITRSGVPADGIECECVSVNNCNEEDMIITQEDLGSDSRYALSPFRPPEIVEPIRDVSASQWTRGPKRPPTACEPNTKGVAYPIVVPLESFRCNELTEVCCTKPRVSGRASGEEQLGCGQRRITGNPFGKFSVNIAEPGEFPWMLTLENTDNCSATLIHHRLALTAAHCTVGAVPNELLLQAGVWNSNDEPPQTRRVSRIIPHPDYSSQQPRNDIALLVVEEPFVLTANVNPVCLPVTNDKWDPSRCVVAGWRGEEIGGRVVEAVEKGVVNFLPQAECQNVMLVTDLWRNYVLHDSFVCGTEKSGRQSCTGDAGGFVVCPSRKRPDTYLQIGVVSQGMNCDNFGRPGIFTNVLKFLDWINRNYLELGLFDDIDIRSLAKQNE